jgi:tetratricopeptide (TPR) repeat protein
MKTKLNLFLLSISIVVVALIYLKVDHNNKIRLPEKAGMKLITCTSAKFMLDDIDSTRQVAPLFDNLGDHTFKIDTKVPETQVFFDQGLNLAFAFNHAESHRSFLEASRLDPSSAMPYWGQAYALGPNINDQIPDAERRLKAFEAIQKSMKLSEGSSAREKALINALSLRYSNDTLADIKLLNMRYMQAMAEVAKTYENDADVLTLYAASVMNTVPWDYWDENGNPSPNIKEAKMALEKAVTLDPEHPGAHHYYIHMVELPKPDMAVASADKLTYLMPGAGHMVHMPGHIYMRVGRYKDAVEANKAAILVDEKYISQCYAQGLYPLGYYPHNIHFLWSAASMMGNEELAIDAAKKTAEKVSVSNLKEARFFQNFAATPLLAYLRFGKWNEILTTPDPGIEYTYLNMIWHYSRGVAFVRKENLKEAKEELEFLEGRDKELEFENISKVAFEVLAGEIAGLEGDLSKSIAHLKKAVQYEDELPYDEPSVWYIPTRQNLGSALLKSKKYEEAELVFREDLTYYRQNGWSLIGLYESLLNQGKSEEAKNIKDEFTIAWENSDIEISNSVF